jgi:prepilin signal peptidase PulO-like enzyme (type II secretory pathway)
LTSSAPPPYFTRVDPSAYEKLFATFAFILGAVVGSFLNVCIYRMPLDLSVNEPKRSFCPHCKNQIPWSQNIPLFSWLACCAANAPIAARRSPSGISASNCLTALLFLAAWLKCWNSGHWELAFPLWILLGLMIVATFIDFEHFIIPNEITWGGVAAGILLSLGFPAMMDTDSHLMSLLWSAAAAAAGYATLWLVVELGKKAFGKKRIELEKPEPFTWTRHGDDADLVAGGDTMKWSDLFSRPRTSSSCTSRRPASGKKPTRKRRSLLLQPPAGGIRRVRTGQARPNFRHRHRPGDPARGDGLWRREVHRGHRRVPGMRAVFFTIMSGSIIGASSAC